MIHLYHRYHRGVTSNRVGTIDHCLLIISRESACYTMSQGTEMRRMYTTTLHQGRGPYYPLIVHLDSKTASTLMVHKSRFVPLKQCFLIEWDHHASDGFYTLMHEDFHTSMACIRITLRPHKIHSLENIVAIRGE